MAASDDSDRRFAPAAEEWPIRPGSGVALESAAGALDNGEQAPIA